MIDGLQVLDWDAVLARPTDVPWVPGRDVHLLPAVTVDEACEEVDGFAGVGLLLCLLPDGVRAVPHIVGDDGLDLVDDPLALGLLEDMAAPIGIGFGVVHSQYPLGGGIGDEAIDGGVREFGAV